MIKLKRPAGLFLCGGGALGSWQSGVLAKLASAGLEFDAVAGFSIGSLNGAAWCYNRTAELKPIWANLKSERVMKFEPRWHNMPIEVYQNSSGRFFEGLKLGLQNNFAKATFFSNEPIYDFLNAWLSRSSNSFARNCRFYVISHCVEQRLPYISRFDGQAQGHKLSFTHALVASCSIPLVFPPVPLLEHGRRLHLVDGGVIGIATINLNIFEGCRSVVMIGNTRDEDLEYSKSGFMGYFETKARRMLALHTARIYDSRVLIKSKPDVHYIRPPVPLELGLLEFEGPKCEAAFRIGEEEGGRFLSALA